MKTEALQLDNPALEAGMELFFPILTRMVQEKISLRESLEEMGINRNGALALEIARISLVAKSAANRVGVETFRIGVFQDEPEGILDILDLKILGKIFIGFYAKKQDDKKSVH